MVGFEKVLEAVKVIKDQIQYRSQSLLNLARGYFRRKQTSKRAVNNMEVDDSLAPFAFVL